MIILESERLMLRNFEASDWRDLHEYLSQENVLMYEPDTARNEEECKLMAAERSQGNAFVAVCLKNTNKMIGHIYFAQREPEPFLTWMIGYIFNPEFYGKGYATEACQAVLKYGFEELGAHRIMALCNPDNAPSWRLLERLSMRREGHFKKEDFFRKTESGEPIWHDAYQYSILNEEWNIDTYKQ
ncbi:GNAT family N-acetyltransferase [Paenibacillus sp. NPDC056722]|uniref:GNAT family N-acetyltransferase n=1 Tax=Paenibacillus sp. NPDC056722 TaxID=3345924 RepID=UPI00369D57D0